MLCSLLQVLYLRLHFFNQVKPHMVKMLIARVVIGTWTFATRVLSIMIIPIGTFSVLVNTAPFWAAILGFLIAGDTILKFEIICMIGCFVGVIILTQGREEQTRKNSFLGICFAMITAWGYSFVMVATRYLQEIDMPLMNLYYSFTSATSFGLYLVILK